MSIGTNTSVMLLIMLGFAMLQVLLSRTESKWPGLLLPAITFLFSLVFPLNMVAPSGGITAGYVGTLLLIWLISNIPTLILLAIYAVFRGKHNHKKQMNKMNIQDLG